jgi:uncharacterized protein (TIGR03437 family)
VTKLSAFNIHEVLRSLLVAQNEQRLRITSIADASVGLAAESLAAAMGANLASQTVTAQSLPWPTTLGGVSVQLLDSASVSRPAGIFLVSSKQINFQVPAGTAAGAAVTILSRTAKPTLRTGSGKCAFAIVLAWRR